jgi:hypothetical protein
MDEKNKRRFDALSILWKGAWDNFHQRRLYEWKFCFMIWAAIAAFIGSLLYGKYNTRNISALIIIIIIGLFIICLHIIWVRGIYQGNKADQKIAFHYERKMRNLSDSEFPEDLANYLKIIQERSWFWNHGTQIGMTILLLLAAFLMAIIGKP